MIYVRNKPNILIALVLLIAFFEGCRPSGSGKEGADSSNTKYVELKYVGTDSPKSAFSGPLNSAFLDELFIDTANFSKLNDWGKRKVTFRFHITNPDSLTLRAWINDNQSSRFPGKDSVPQFTMHNGVNTGIQLVDSVDLGNLVLTGNQVNTILATATTKKAKYVLFVPLDPKTNGRQVIYDILVTDKDPLTLPPDDKSFTSPTGVVTNPSPPRNANG